MADAAPVSVIIPALNAAETIERALRSVASQTLQPTQVIIVDDGSSDQTKEKALGCRDFMDGINFDVICQENAGAGAARNHGVSMADQPYIAFLDADDEWLPKKLERSMGVIEEGGFDLIAHDFVAHHDGIDQLVSASHYFSRTEEPLTELYIRGYIPSITVVARRDLIKSVSGFDDTLPNAQDFDLWLAMLLQPGVRFTVFDEPLARYRQGPTGIMSHTERRLSCCLRIARRYASQFSLNAHITRILAVHKEALAAHFANKKWLLAASIPFRLLIALFAEPLTTVFTTKGDAVRHPKNRQLLIVSLSSLWMIGVLALYVAQFGNIFGAVFRVLGIQ